MSVQENHDHPAPDDRDAFAEGVLERIERLGLEVADIAGTIEGLSQFVHHQEQLFANLKDIAHAMAVAIGRIDTAGQETRAATAQAERKTNESLRTIEEALTDINHLVGAVQRIESRLEELEDALGEVGAMSRSIQKIARQTNLLALNATIEAERAGAAGKGFGVVAGEVKSLARQTASATEGIDATVGKLSGSVNDLIATSTDTLRMADSVGSGVGVINHAVTIFGEAIDTVESRVDDIAAAASSSIARCDTVLGEIDKFFDGVAQTSQSLRTADERIASLLGNSESLIGFIAESGYRTMDTPFIERVTQSAAAIATLFERALADGKIDLDTLFDTDYRPIDGTNPPQFTTRYLAFADQVLPDIQEPLLAWDSRVVFVVAVDRNAFLPTHNRVFSHPQGSDPVWNNAHCRNRRFFDDRTGGKAARNTRPFLLQTYRRDMGGGQYVLMKDLSAPIHVQGRHWGGLRMGYRL